MKKLTHLNEQGQAHMVDVGTKPVTAREAVAQALVSMSRKTYRLLTGGRIPKGDVFATARIAGIQAAKRTPELIPLCHALQLTSVDIEFERVPKELQIRVVARARATDRTGVEMEAMVAASVAALTIYDMCKAVERGMEIGPVLLLEKRGGKSGEWIAE